MEVYVIGGTLRQPWNRVDTTPFHMNVSVQLTEGHRLRRLPQTMEKVKLKFKPFAYTLILENRVRMPIFGHKYIEM
jgi:hypothetical protein